MIGSSKKTSPTDSTVATFGGHSALEICLGAKKLGLNTLVIAEKGKEKPYSQYYKTEGDKGCVDDCIVVGNPADVLSDTVIKQLKEKNAIFIPHKAFEEYMSNYDNIEKSFDVPLFGNRKLLRSRKIDTEINQYDLLEQAGIAMPKIFTDPDEIDRVCLVKIAADKDHERVFFIVKNGRDFMDKVGLGLQQGFFTQEQIKIAVVEEYIMGSQIGLNFFYSALEGRLELISTDMRRQTNIEGLSRIPAFHQEDLLEMIDLTYEEAGHSPASVPESMLSDIYEIAEKFVAATQKSYAPGVIGPFTLRGFITAGTPTTDLVITDVSFGIPSSANSNLYSTYQQREPISMGERVAQEVLTGLETNKLEKITT